MTEPAAVPPRPVLAARCENFTDDDDFGGTTCLGRIHFRWGQSQAACDTCGAYCGIAVAKWQAVIPAGAARGTGRPATEPFLAQLRREQAAIGAHHARKASRRLHWVWDLGHRKPWRSSGPVPWKHLPSLVEWVRNAHDCSDASLMCSCAGSPRFPRRVEAL